MKLICTYKQNKNGFMQEIKELKTINSNLTTLLNKKGNDTKTIFSEHTFKKFFSNGQIKAISMGDIWKNKIKSNSDEISRALSLHNISPKAYRFLKDKLNHPLPSVTTLKRWTSMLKIHNGLLEDVMSIMKGKGLQMTENERITVLSFDEVSVSTQVELEKKYSVL